MIHLATAAIVNAVWDLYAKLEGKPLWKLLADLTPEQIVACVDFRYIDDALTPDEALALLRRNERDEGRARGSCCSHEGFPAYTTSAGWLGYPEDTLPERAREAIDAGFTHLKLKVGGDLETRPAPCAHRARGDRAGHRLSLDANQAWGVEQAIEADPTASPRSTRGGSRSRRARTTSSATRIRDAVAPVRVATGEHVQNRVVFKQLLQLEAIDVCQIDCCRLGGVNEVLAVLLLAAKFGVPVCPHAGGVGLCEYAQHVSMFDYIAVSGSLDDRVCEFVDHLHEHFVDPVASCDGRYLAPTAPGYSIEIRPESLAEFAFPDGPGWWRRKYPHDHRRPERSTKEGYVKLASFGVLALAGSPASSPRQLLPPAGTRRRRRASRSASRSPATARTSGARTSPSRRRPRRSTASRSSARSRPTATRASRPHRSRR